MNVGTRLELGLVGGGKVRYGELGVEGGICKSHSQFKLASEILLEKIVYH